MSKEDSFLGYKITDKRLLWVLARIVIAIWLLCWIGIMLLYKNTDQRGQFGDMFGAVNSLFSGLAFAGILYTIFLQREEIQSTNTAFKVQQFDSIFFNLLTMHNNSVLQNTKYSSSEGVLAFHSFVQQSTLTEIYKIFSHNEIKILNKDYERFCASYQKDTYHRAYTHFQHYLKSIEVIYECVINGTEKELHKKYLNIFKSYFTVYEILFLHTHLNLSSGTKSEIIRLKAICKEMDLFHFRPDIEIVEIV